MNVQHAMQSLATRDGAAAALALVAWLLFAWIAGVAVPAQRRTFEAERGAVAAERKQVLRQTAWLRKSSGVIDGSVAFAAGFPSAQSRPERVAQLIALAQQHGLSWQRSEYVYGVDAQLPLSRYQLAMPLSGSYESLRSFIAEALANDDALALDGLQLRRAEAKTPELQAELRFTLFARAETPATHVVREDAR